MSYQPSSFSFQLELTRGDGERARGTSGAEARSVDSGINAGLKASTTLKLDLAIQPSLKRDASAGFTVDGRR